jgi:putative flavoprotein involved in K+ transport
VIWCTGYTPGFEWIDLPIHGKTEPLHERGFVASQPGLYFVGLQFEYALSSSQIHGVSRDAERVVRAIARSTSRALPPERAGSLELDPQPAIC